MQIRRGERNSIGIIIGEEKHFDMHILKSTCRVVIQQHYIIVIIIRIYY